MWKEFKPPLPISWTPENFQLPKQYCFLPVAWWVTLRAHLLEWGLSNWSQSSNASQWLFLYEVSWQKTKICKENIFPQTLPLPATLPGTRAGWPCSAPHLCHGKAQLYLHCWKATSSCWSQIVTSLLKCSNCTVSWSCLVQFSGCTKESFQLSVPHLFAFAKWCSEFPVMAWEGKASEQGLSSITESIKPGRSCFFLGVLCYKGITTVWKVNKLHHVQRLTEKTGWQAETWESWVSYWTVLWCGTNHCAVFTPLIVPSRSGCQLCTDKSWVLTNMHTLLSTLQPLSHLRLLGVLVTRIITLNSSISYGGKPQEKYLVCAFVYIKVIGMERCHRKYCNYSVVFWR